jgi:hypothetical protein
MIKGMNKLQFAPYSPEALVIKRQTLSHLSERGRRLFISQEYLSLGNGSQRYLSEVFGLNRTSIRQGAKELLSGETLELDRQRKHGGGRKKKNMSK